MTKKENKMIDELAKVFLAYDFFDDAKPVDAAYDALLSVYDALPQYLSEALRDKCHNMQNCTKY